MARLMATLLFGVAATDLTSFAVATLLVVGSAVGASLAPAWRAATHNPIAALRRS
jgi:ABC-type lipoprotein release transport system permease subunit